MRFKVLSTIALLGFAGPVQAGVFSDDMSRCLVAKTSDADRIALMRMFFAAMAKDPALADLAQVPQAKLDSINKSASDLYERLIFVDCRPQAVAALKNEGPSAFNQAFEVLGGAAARGLLSSPASQAELDRFAALSDKAKWQALGKEAGVNLEDK
jgi:hypothetical protein